MHDSPHFTVTPANAEEEARWSAMQGSKPEATPNPAARFTVTAPGDGTIGGFELNTLDTVVEMRGLWLAEGHAAQYGVPLLRSIVEMARPLGTMLTIESFPASLSGLFIEAGFGHNTRTRMAKSLVGYEPQQVTIPEGVTLRHPHGGDEGPLAAMSYIHYKGTRDEPMASVSPAQGDALMRAIFHNEYALLDPNGSFVALDRAGEPVGAVLVGDESDRDPARLAWIIDISIAAEWRGKGLGRALLLQAFNEAHAHGYPRIGLIVTLGNTPAHTLYRSLGFEDYGEVMYEGWIELAEDGAEPV